jgi:hypothetical protein
MGSWALVREEWDIIRIPEGFLNVWHVFRKQYVGKGSTAEDVGSCSGGFFFTLLGHQIFFPLDSATTRGEEMRTCMFSNRAVKNALPDVPRH